MDFGNSMHLYFRGEKLESVFILLASLALLVTGAVLLLAVHQAFTRALGLTLLVSSVIGGIVGATVFLRTDRQVEQLDTMLSSNRQTLLSAEQPRMQQVVKSFAYYRVAYSAAAVLAAIVSWFVARPALQGLAVGLLVFAAFGLVVDHYAEHRALSYIRALDALEATPRPS